MEIMREAGVGSSLIERGWNLQFNARFHGELSDDELTSESEGASFDEDNDKEEKSIANATVDDATSGDHKGVFEFQGVTEGNSSSSRVPFSFISNQVQVKVPKL